MSIVKQIRQVEDLDRMLVIRADFSDNVFEKHFHDHYVIALNVRGGHDFYFNRTTYFAGPDNIVLIPPGEIHTGRKPNAINEWGYSAIYPRAETINRIFGEETKLMSRIDEYPLVQDQQAQHYLNDCISFFLTEEFELGTESMIDFLRVLIDGEKDENNRSMLPPKIIARIHDFLHDQVEEKLSLDQLEKTFGYTKYHIVRLFKKYYGLSPLRYHRMIRLSRSIALLGKQNNIAQTAYQLNFFDQPHFTRSFKKYYGFTPNELFSNNK